MFQKRKRFPRKKKFITVAIIASFLLLLRPSIFFNSNHKKLSKQSETSIVIEKNHLVSVSIDNRYFYIAQKVTDKKYKLLYVDQYHSLKECQEVLTTGLDEQFAPDLRIGKIIKITADPESIFANIEVEDSTVCNIS